MVRLQLQDIYEYIAKDNPAAAANVVQGIYRRTEVLVARLPGLLTICRRCAGKVILTDLIPGLEVEYNQHVHGISGAVRYR